MPEQINLTNWKGDESLDALPASEPYVRDAVSDYVMDGKLAESKGFFRALLENNFLLTAIRADGVNTLRLKQWAKWLINHCPEGAYGSKHLVDNWIKIGGINGNSNREGVDAS